jgi:ATP-binding cassette, subfamily B, bacterial
LRVVRGDIALQNVSFAYHDASNNDKIFNNLELFIPAGQKVGLVGPSGGGKSTLTRLLLRFDDIDNGSVAIDGQDIRQVTQASLRRSISYVPQEPLLFHRSILDNIAYGKPNATLEEVRRAASLAYADDFISSLPQGYDTIVGERGVKLSGGQRQRVAIARAILKDAPILVLDEATSALDSESEVYIQKALEELMKGRTTIVIAHRLSTIQKMDRILVLENGRIAEDGKHDKLLTQKGLYAKLWTHQSGGFIEE